MSEYTVDPTARARTLLGRIPIVESLCVMVICVGLAAPVAQAQGAATANTAPAERARLLAQQQAPHKAVPFNPAHFDGFVGYYRFGRSDSPRAFAHVYRNGDRYYVQLTAQRPVEVFPDSPTEFFATVVAAQISFVTGSAGTVTRMILHQNGYLRPWARSTKSADDAFAAQLRHRIRDDRPSAGTEAAIRRQLHSLERSGHQLYAQMTPMLAAAARAQDPHHTAMWKRLGALRSLRFDRVLPNGNDDYLATFAHGHLVIIIAPLTRTGKISGLLYHMP